MLTFSDGMKFDTDGPLRLTHRSDGWYVVGGGMLFGVESAEEGQEEIDRMNKTACKQCGVVATPADLEEFGGVCSGCAGTRK